MPKPKDPRIDALFANVAANLKRARISRKGPDGGELTQREAAFAIGTDPQMIARWERGDTQINAGHLKLLADFFRYPVDDFFEVVPKFIPLKPQPTEGVPAPQSPPKPGAPSHRPSRPAHRG